MGPFDQIPSGVTFEEMRVTSVNETNYTVDLTGESPNSTYAVGVPWPSPHSHPDGGGIETLPEVGATVWVVWHENDSMPLILSCSHPPVLGEGFGANRIGIKSGETCLWTRAGNRIILHKNGNLSLVAGEQCKRIYFPLRNLIEDMSSNYRMVLDGGTFSWLTSSDTEGRSILSLEASRYSGEEASFTLLLGDVKHPKKGEVLAYLSSEGFSLTIDHDGNIESESKNVSSTVDGNFSTTVGGDITVSCKGALTLSSTGDVAIKTGGSHSLVARDSTETILGMKKISATSVSLGRAAIHPVLLGDLALLALLTHTHPLPGGPPGPDFATQLQNALSLSVVVSK